MLTRMRFSRIVRDGWAEGLVGLLCLGSSMFGLLGGRIPLWSTLLDVVSFGCLVVCLRWLKLGTALMGVTVLMGLGVDPNAYGMTFYIAACALVAAVRAGRFALAVPVTVIYGMALSAVSYRRSQYQELLGSLVSTCFLLLVAWAIGLGFYAVRRLEAQRVAGVFQQRQLLVAADMHDFVGRHLTNLIMHAELARGRGESDPKILDELAERARLANRALREVTSTLRGETLSSPRIGLQEALDEGVRELKESGFNVREPNREHQESQPALAEDVDLAAGRIIQEALHNAAKHGLPPGPVVVAVERTDASLDIAVSNPTDVVTKQTRDGMGLDMIRQHAAVLGGKVQFEHADGVWACAAALPLLGMGVRHDPSRNL